MNGATRIWVAACVVATAAVLAGGWFVGVQPQLSAASDAADSTTAVDAQNQANQIKLAVLTKAAAKSDALQAENATLLKSVPTILKPNTFIRRINELSALDGVTVASVAFSDSASYTTPVTSAGLLALGKTDPAINSADFASIPVSIQVKGTADATMQFAHDVQNDERVFAINNVLTTVDDNGVTTATLSGLIYTLKR